MGKVAVIDSGINECDGAECVQKEQALILYSDDDDDVTVVQPNEDGSYWRKIVRNKMHRMKEQPRQGREEVDAGHARRGERSQRAVVVGSVHVDHRPGVQKERFVAARHLDGTEGQRAQIVSTKS